MIFLPRPVDDESFYERMARERDKGAPNFQITARVSFNLPRSPAFALDLDCDETSFRRLASYAWPEGAQMPGQSTGAQ